MNREVVVLADADNTLWDTDSVFAKAQLALLTRVEDAAGTKCNAEDRLAFVRRYDQELAARHHLHLKYPSRLLVAALAAGVRGQSSPRDSAADLIAGRPMPSQLDATTVDAAIRAYEDELSQTPALLPSVREGLIRARSAAIAMYVMTEGRAERQRVIIRTHGLDEYFAGVWELAKNKEQFARLRRRFTEATVVVIGDQPDRDISPAHQAGCLTVLIPSRFRPKWHQEGDWSSADLVATDFEEAVNWALIRSASRVRA